MNDNIGPPFLDPTRLGPSDWQPIGAAVFGIAALGLGLKDVIAYRTLAGYVVVLGIICGVLALALAVNGEKRPKPRSVAWMFGVGRLFGVAGVFLLVIGSGHGSWLNNGGG